MGGEQDHSVHWNIMPRIRLHYEGHDESLRVFKRIQGGRGPQPQVEWLGRGAAEVVPLQGSGAECLPLDWVLAL